MCYTYLVCVYSCVLLLHILMRRYDCVLCLFGVCVFVCMITAYVNEIVYTWFGVCVFVCMITACVLMRWYTVCYVRLVV